MVGRWQSLQPWRPGILTHNAASDSGTGITALDSFEISIAHMRTGASTCGAQFGRNASVHMIEPAQAQGRVLQIPRRTGPHAGRDENPMGLPFEGLHTCDPFRSLDHCLAKYERSRSVPGQSARTFQGGSLRRPHQG